MKRVILVGAVAIALVAGGFLAAIVRARPSVEPAGPTPFEGYVDKEGDEELAFLLVRLLRETRAVMAEHYTRSQSPLPGVDLLYKRWLARNRILPAAIADAVFAEVVPGATGGRAWIRMVVDTPRNPRNRGDDVALNLLAEIRADRKPHAERKTSEAYYYAEPIQAKASCLPCHGEPKGDPDPVFPQFQMDGWRVGDIVGAIVARVAPEK